MYQISVIIIWITAVQEIYVFCVSADLAVCGWGVVIYLHVMSVHAELLFVLIVGGESP